MTELEREAEEQAKKIEENQTVGVYDRDEDLEYDKGWNVGEVSGFKDGYIAGAEAREKRIAELEAMIEKMKCCSNCNHFNKVDDLEYCWNCDRSLVNSLDNLSKEEIIKDEWEIEENGKRRT